VTQIVLLTDKHCGKDQRSAVEAVCIGLLVANLHEIFRNSLDTRFTGTNSPMLRKILLNIHLVLGLTAAALLVVLGLTGSILAFGDSYDRWLNPSLWRVAPQGRPLTESSLRSTVEDAFPDDRVRTIDIGDRVSAQVFTLASGAMVFVNPYSGTILGTRQNREGAAFLKTVRKIHTRLGAGYMGRWVVDIATIYLLLLIPTGLYLWWRKKRLTIAWRKSRVRINWDLHSAAGAYAAFFLLVLSVTGFFIGFEGALFWVTRSTPQPEAPRVRSTAPANAGTPGANLDTVLVAAGREFPKLRAARIRLPGAPRDPYVVEEQTPVWTAGAARSMVYVDRYTGGVLRVADARQFTRGYRAYRINLAIHTGEMMGSVWQFLELSSGLLLGLVTVTGVVIWVLKKRVAVFFPALPGRHVGATDREFTAAAGSRKDLPNPAT
jgi:uncharacterized iron-regulated membrane protein